MAARCPVHGWQMEMAPYNGSVSDCEKHGRDASRLSVESRAEERLVPQRPAQRGPADVPDGGWQARLQIVGSWILFFNTWGILNTFGVYQTFYERGTIFTESSSNISWIGSVQSLTLLIVGAFVGPIYDHGGLRSLLAIGTFGMAAGHMLLSLCNAYWQVLLAQGFVVGMSGGCLYVPAVAILPTYFSSRLGMALGIAASGSSAGGILYPILFKYMIDNIGFNWAVQIIGFIAFIMLIIPLTVLRMRTRPPAVRSLVDWTAFTDGPYMLFVLGLTLGLIGTYFFFFYASFFGLSTGMIDPNLAFYLVPILNAASIVGRTLLTWLSDKIGLFNVMAPTALLTSAVLWSNLVVVDAAGVITTTALLGFSTGVFVALTPAVFVSLSKDKSKIGTRIGMGWAMAGSGVLAGGAGGGAVLGAAGSDLHWRSAWIYAAATTLASAAILIALRVWKSRSKLIMKV